jgi:hypothetical protein
MRAFQLSVPLISSILLQVTHEVDCPPQGTKAAQELGANAIVGVDIDYEVLGEKNGMLMVSVSGTAVIVK